MVINELKINKKVVSLELIADEDKLLYLSEELEDLDSDAVGVPNIYVPVSFDLTNIIEKTRY